MDPKAYKRVNLAGTLNLPGFLEMETTLSKPLPLKNHLPDSLARSV
jgi:hypothetical protein